MATIDLGFQKIREIGARSGRAVLALVAWPASLSLAGQFFLASLAVLVTAMLLTGEWVGQMVERSVLTRSAALSALYVESVLGDHLAALASQPRLDPTDIAAFDRLLTASPLSERVNAFKVWSSDGEVLYSPDRRLIGKRFDVDGGLELALQGEVSADLSDLAQPENAYERERWSRLLEVYTPVRQQDPGGRILAVVEFYQAPDAVDREVGAARRESWALVALVTTFIYVLLAGLVKRGSDTIARNLCELAILHARLRVAGVRTIALNEQSLRRISADLHDGPGQVLALALLRLDRLYDTAACAPNSGHASGEIEVLRGALQQSLMELRAIAAGLRLPQLETGDLAELAARAVRDHERRTGVQVALAIGSLPKSILVATKIALLRSLQEGLSNASRHGLGRDVQVRIWSDQSTLRMDVVDAGPGFLVEQAQMTGLGLAGMRERAELLGGSFGVDSAQGRGTAVHLSWPVGEASGPPRDDRRPTSLLGSARQLGNSARRR